MTATRSTKEEYAYRKQCRDSDCSKCPFCDITKNDSQYVEETLYFKVIYNRFPYSIWDGQSVSDHLMITPKKHTDKLGGICADAAVEYFNLVNRYELMGYNLYSRAPNSNVKSVTHQHTHLLKLNGKERRFVFLLRKPFYIRVSCK